jgi:hypothetical protein
VGIAGFANLASRPTMLDVVVRLAVRATQMVTLRTYYFAFAIGAHGVAVAGWRRASFVTTFAMVRVGGKIVTATSLAEFALRLRARTGVDAFAIGTHLRAAAFDAARSTTFTRRHVSLTHVVGRRGTVLLSRQTCAVRNCANASNARDTWGVRRKVRRGRAIMSAGPAILGIGL